MTIELEQTQTMIEEPFKSMTIAEAPIKEVRATVALNEKVNGRSQGQFVLEVQQQLEDGNWVVDTEDITTSCEASVLWQGITSEYTNPKPDNAEWEIVSAQMRNATQVALHVRGARMKSSGGRVRGRACVPRARCDSFTCGRTLGRPHAERRAALAS